METYRERLTRLLSAHRKSLGKEELSAIDAELRALLQKSGADALSDELREKTLALYYRNRAKAFLLNYAEGFEAERYQKMRAAVEALCNECPEALQNTARSLETACAALEATDKAVGSVYAPVDPNAGETELRARLQALETARVSALPEEYKFLSDAAERFLAGRKAETSVALDALRDAKYGADWNRAEVNLQAYRFYDYYPAFSVGKNDGNKAVALFTPFREEAELYVSAVARVEKREIRAFDCSKLAAATEDARDYCFEKLTANKFVALFGLDRLPAALKRETIGKIAALAASAERIYLHDPDPERGIYSELLSLVKTDGVFLSVPECEEAAQTLEKLGYFSDGEDRKFFKENAVSIGFVGFNLATIAGKDGWKRAVTKKAKENQKVFSDYLLKLSNRALFLDDGWGYDPDYRIPVEKTGRKLFTFDYDASRGYNPENLRAILEGDFSLKAKCGMVSKYCLFLGEDDERWIALGTTEEGKEERKRRLFNVISILSGLMGVARPPKTVEIIPKEEYGSRGGGHCDYANAIIVFREDCLDSTDWLLTAPIHEVYHCFQHTAMDAKVFQKWWTDELGVTPERVQVWTYNYSERYYQIDQNYKAYMVQVYESDARIFEAECRREENEHWAELSLV